MAVGREIKFNTKVNGSGQECPLHTNIRRRCAIRSRLQSLNYQALADILSLSRELGTFVILPSRIC
jgi:hypothetical protein